MPNFPPPDGRNNLRADIPHAEKQPSKMPRSAFYMAIFSCVLCVTLGALLLWTGQRVQQVEQSIQIKNQDLLYEQERIRVLRAEWARLNSPERLDFLMQEKEAAEGKSESQDRYKKRLDRNTNNARYKGYLKNDGGNSE